MSRDPKADALAIWLVEQQTSRLAQHQPPGELHLHQHQHHYAAPAPAPAPVTDPAPTKTMRLHPIFVATYILFLSIAISVPLALLAAIVESTNQPSVQYVRPSQGGW